MNKHLRIDLVRMSNLLQAYNDLKETELINEMAITKTR